MSRFSKIAARVAYPPGKVDMGGWPSVFLAGAIDMGEARDWHSEVIKALEDVDCTVLNPRRKQWDSSWKQEMSNPKFLEQVNWELDGMDVVDCVAVCLPAESKAPISLMELGLHAPDGNVIVCCEKGYWRKGNVDIVCARYGVPVYDDFDEFVAEVVSRMRVVRIANRVAGPARGGDCYEAAGKYEMDHGMAGDILVHGEVKGQGSLKGIRFGHAWVENGGTVIDESNGKHLRMPKDVYYALGDIRRTVKYSYKEFLKKVVEAKHWGPWDLHTQY